MYENGNLAPCSVVYRYRCLAEKLCKVFGVNLSLIDNPSTVLVIYTLTSTQCADIFINYFLYYTRHLRVMKTSQSQTEKNNRLSLCYYFKSKPIISC